jgi:hypothetical protein
MLCALQVRDALASKVSRERVGAELEGMFKGAVSWPAALLFQAQSHSERTNAHNKDEKQSLT